MTSKICFGILDTSVCRRLSAPNVSPGGEQSLAESPHHGLKLRSFFINASCHPSPEVFYWTRWMIQKINVIILKMQYYLVEKIQTSHKSALSLKSDYRSNMPMYPAAFWRLCTTWSYIDAMYENTPHTMIKPPPMCLVVKDSGGLTWSC